MANVVQWSIDEFWSQLQNLKSMLDSAKTDLLADKQQLQSLWTATTKNTDATQRAQDQKLLTPLIHQNSVLRLSYLQPLTDQFNQAVKLGSDALASAGYTTPTLNSLGFVIALAPLAAVTIIVAALAVAAAMIAMTQAQRNHTATVAGIVNNQKLSPQQQTDLLNAIANDNKTAAGATKPPALFDVSGLVPILGLVAVIMLGPQLLKMVPKRGTA